MSIIENIRDIIKYSMGLQDNQIFLENQDVEIATNKGIYIVLGMLTDKVFSNNKHYEYRNNDGYYIIQSINKMTIISIDIFSRNMDAFDRKEEIIFSLNNDYSMAQQLLKTFKILRIPSSFSNISTTEGVSKLNRFNINIEVINMLIKETKTEYYDNFQKLEIYK